MPSNPLAGGINTAAKLMKTVNDAYAEAGKNNFELQPPGIFAPGVDDGSIQQKDWPAHTDGQTAIALGATPADENIIFPCTASDGTTHFANAAMILQKWGENWLDGVQAYIDSVVPPTDPVPVANGGFTATDPATGQQVPVNTAGGVSFVDKDGNAVKP